MEWIQVYRRIARSGGHGTWLLKGTSIILQTGTIHYCWCCCCTRTGTYGLGFVVLGVFFLLSFCLYSKYNAFNGIRFMYNHNVNIIIVYDPQIIQDTYLYLTTHNLEKCILLTYYYLQYILLQQLYRYPTSIFCVTGNKLS